MINFSARLSVLSVLLLHSTLCLAAGQPVVEVSKDAVIVTVAGQTLAAALSNGQLALKTPDQTVHFTLAMQQGTEWITPGPCASPPEISRRADSVCARVTYPVLDERELTLELHAYRDLPAVFVTSRLVRLGSASAQYYFWSTDVTFDHYLAAGEEAPRDVNIDKSKWEPIPCRDWLFFPTEEGGLAVLPTNDVGRAPGDKGCLFLHSLPKSTVLASGDSLDASFGIALVDKVDSAAALSAKARARRVPTLEPWSQDPLAARRDRGKPAPEWLRQAEVYNLFYHPAGQWTDQVVQEKLRHFPFIIGSTPDKAALERCHKAGVRLLHYVVYTCLLDTDMQTREGGTVYSEWVESLDNQARDLKNHPDWACIDANGKIQKDAWGQSHHHPGLLNTCLHQPGLQEAALRQVRMLMEIGFDGVFIDLAGPSVECYGPKFGKHFHPDPKKTNTQAYEDLLKKIYETVKRFGKDRVVLQNTCVSVMPSHWPYADMQMLEAFPYGSESTERRANWQELQWTAARHGEAAKNGKVPVLLSYFNTFSAKQVKEPALYSYVYARLFGFAWADGLTLTEIPGNHEFANALYRTRLGKPISEVRNAGKSRYRHFEKGLVILNPTQTTVVVTVPVVNDKPLEDIGYDRKLKPSDKRLRLEMAPESGRILVRGGDAQTVQ